MDKKFTIIESTDEDRNKAMDCVYGLADLSDMWSKQFYTALEKACTGETGTLQEVPQEGLIKSGLAGVKYICFKHKVDKEYQKLGLGEENKTLKNIQGKYVIINSVLVVLGCLTLRNFVTTFPVEKRYDGEKWQRKDYFYTMDVLSKMDWDKPIGEDNILDFLWNYENRDLREVCVEYVTVMSDLYREQTGKSFAEKWCEDNGIDTYTEDKGTGLLKNNQTGAIMKMPKRSHITIVE